MVYGYIQRDGLSFFFFFFQFGPNCSLLTNARVNLIQRDSEGSTAENGKGDRDLTTPF